jgi:hypothetical protein
MVRRHGRLGWFLDDVKGPKNAEVGTSNLEIIYQSFAEAKVPQDSMIEALEQLYEEQDDPGFDGDL